MNTISQWYKPQRMAALVGLCLSVAVAPAWGQRVKPDFDFSAIQPKPVQERQIAQPKIQWLVHQTPSTVCQQKDPSASHTYGQHNMCVVWNVEAQSCTMVTTPRTTHSQLGWLFLHCVEGRS